MTLFDGDTEIAAGTALSALAGKTLTWGITGVAEVNGTVYETFEEALEAVQDGGTITLLDNVVLDDTIVVNDGKKFTIDTNGKKISSAKRVIEIRRGGVTLTGNGTVETDATSAVAIYGSTNSNDADYATFTLGAGTTISAPNGYGAMIGSNPATSKGDAYGAKLTLNGTINSKYGVYINGNVQEPADKTNAAQITINGTVTASDEEAAVYAAGYAKWTVNEGSTISGGSGIYIKSGDLTVNGGTITANGAKTAYAFNSNGANGTGDAIIIDSCGYPGNVPTVKINGGTVTSANGKAVASYTKQDDPLYSDAEYPRVNDVVTGNSTAVFSSDVTELAEAGYKTTFDETKGGYIVNLKEGVVARIGDQTFNSFEEAWNAAQDGDTITLLDDVAVDSTIVLNDGRRITIDTNGNDITSTVRVFEIRHGGVTLTGDGTVSTTAVSAVAVYGSTNSADADYATFTLGADTTISAPNGYGAMIGANSKAAYGAKLTLNGTIDSKYGVFVNGNVQEPADKTNAAQVTINGKVTASNANAVVYAAGYAKWTVNEGSTLTGGSGIYIKSGDLTVNGGTITATGAKTAYVFNSNGANGTGDAIIVDSCGYPGGAPTVAITGGTFISENNQAVASYTKQDDPRYSDATFERVDDIISGGEFSSDVTELLTDEAKETVAKGTNPDAPFVIQTATAENAYSLTVDHSIAMNAYIDVDAYEGDAVRVTYNDADALDPSQKGTKTEEFTTASEDEKGRWILEITQAPAQIADEVKFDIMKNDKVVRTIKTSVAEYLVQASTSDDAKLANLAKAMFDYGKATYAASGYVGEDNFAEAKGDSNYYNTTDTDASVAGREVFNKVNADGFEFNGLAFVATSTPSLRAYCNFTEAQAVEANLDHLDVSDKTGKVCANLGSVNPEDFDKELSVVLNNNASITTNVIKYANLASNGGKADLGRSIRNYYAAARNYWV